jgi:alpha-galactosidase/6-phospho-beta-glucosidase family protein
MQQLEDERVKIAVIGAGSYVFSMGLLYDLIVKNKLNGINLMLMDVNLETARMVSLVAQRMIDEHQADVKVDYTIDRIKALQSAQFVTVSAAIQLQRRYEMDVEVLRKYNIEEITSECGGVGGLSYTLRSAKLVLDIARDMEKYCPNAWLLDATNPLTRVISAITRYSNIRTIGFCNVSNGNENGYDNIEKLIGRKKEELTIVSAGLNHFSWLLSVKDKDTDEDLMQLVHTAINSGVWDDRPLTIKCYKEYGYLPLAGDAHIGEFLPFDSAISEKHYAHHGDEGERLSRIQLLHDVAAGVKPWQLLMEGRSWEKPGDVIAAMVNKTNLELDMVNIANQNFISNLPNGAVVEVPAKIINGEFSGCPVGNLPESITELCMQTSLVHMLAAEAAITGDINILEKCIENDLSIIDKKAAKDAIKELLSVHSDVLEKFITIK